MNEQTKLFLHFAKGRPSVERAVENLNEGLDLLGQNHEADIVRAQELYSEYLSSIHAEFLIFISTIDVKAVATELQQ